MVGETRRFHRLESVCSYAADCTGLTTQRQGLVLLGSLEWQNRGAFAELPLDSLIP